MLECIWVKGIVGTVTSFGHKNNPKVPQICYLQCYSFVWVWSHFFLFWMRLKGKLFSREIHLVWSKRQTRKGWAIKMTIKTREVITSKRRFYKCFNGVPRLFYVSFRWIGIKNCCESGLSTTWKVTVMVIFWVWKVSGSPAIWFSILKKRDWNRLRKSKGFERTFLKETTFLLLIVNHNSQKWFWEFVMLLMWHSQLKAKKKDCFDKLLRLSKGN